MATTWPLWCPTRAFNLTPFLQPAEEESDTMRGLLFESCAYVTATSIVVQSRENTVFVNGLNGHVTPHGRVFDLAHEMRPGMAQSRAAPPFEHRLATDHSAHPRPGDITVATDHLSTGTHVGTHVDSLAHVAHRGMLHGGHDARDAHRSGRFIVGGAEEIPILIRRGVLLDIPAHLGMSSLPPDLAVTDELLEETAQAQQVEVRPGDVGLVRMGWASKFDDVEEFLGVSTGLPGLDVSGAKWLTDRGVVAVGADTVALERVPPDSVSATLPVHVALLVEHGTWIIECLDLDELALSRSPDFIFVMSPLKIVGATGSPVRPFAFLPE